MQNVLAPQSGPSFDPFVLSHAPIAASFLPSCAQDDCPDHQFIAMLDAYRDSGGLARKREMLTWLTSRGGPQAATLAHRVTVARSDLLRVAVADLAAVLRVQAWFAAVAAPTAFELPLYNPNP